MLRFVVQWLIPIALAIFAWVDCLLTPRPYVRLLPKPLWAILIAVPYLGALLWIFSGRAAQPRPHEPRRRATDPAAGLFGGLGRPGSHQARPRIIDTRPRAERRGGMAPSGRAGPPDDDPEVLGRLAAQLERGRPEG